METLLVFIGVIFIIGFVALGALFFVFLQRQKQQGVSQNELALLSNQMNEMRRALDQKLGESTQILQHQFSESAKIIRDVTSGLVKLDETNKQVVNFAGELRKLQDTLLNPKQRGVLGEYSLETILKNVFPPGVYQMQYSFRDGMTVDAVIFVKDRIIPVDSKFSLENYMRAMHAPSDRERAEAMRLFVQDLKTRIDETAKYIRPQEKTLDFAFMFIPAEAMYYDLLINRVGSSQETAVDLVDYAAKKRVFIVSPNSFMAYLQTVLQGLRALKIEESAKEIMKRVQDLSRHIAHYDEYMKKLGVNLGTAVNTYNTAYKELNKIDKDVLRITDEKMGVEPLEIEKPKVFEESEE